MKKKIIILIIIFLIIFSSCSNLKTLEVNLKSLIGNNNFELKRICITRNDLGKAIELKSYNEISDFVKYINNLEYTKRIDENEAEKQGIEFVGIPYQISLYATNNKKVGSILYEPREDLFIVQKNASSDVYFLKNKLKEKLDEFFEKKAVIDL